MSLTCSLDDEVCWELYDRDKLSSLDYLNPLCRKDKVLWRMRAPLIIFYDVEMYFLNRVRCQFRMLQEYPPSDVHTSKELHGLNCQRTTIKDWQDHHQRYITEWERREGCINNVMSIYQRSNYRRYLNYLHEHSRLRLRPAWHFADIEEDSGDFSGTLHMDR